MLAVFIAITQLIFRSRKIFHVLCGKCCIYEEYCSMSSNFDFLKWLRGSPSDNPKEPDNPKPPWLIVKVGDFRVECSQASAQAISPALPVMLRFGWRWLAPSAITFWLLINGIGVGMPEKLCQQVPWPSTPNIAEDVSPQAEGMHH